MIKTIKLVNYLNFNFQLTKTFHLGARASFLNVRDPKVEKKTAEVTIVHEDFFDKLKEKNKKVFYDALQLYITKNNVHRLLS